MDLESKQMLQFNGWKHIWSTAVSVFFSQNHIKYFWDTPTQRTFFLIIQTIIFRGDLTDTLAKTATLAAADCCLFL